MPRGKPDMTRDSRIVGLVGGLGPESTIDYYRRILQGWERARPGSAPAIVIDSLDVQVGLKLVAKSHAELTDYLLASLLRLAGAGVDFAALTANTAHIVFDELAARSPVPLLSIVETCAEEAARRGFRRLALLGTRFTMEAPFYPATFARRGMTVVPMAGEDVTWIHEKYIGELLKGDFRDATRERFVALVAHMRDRDPIDAVILGGTELPLLLASEQVAGLPVLDTTALHVAAIVKRLLEREAASPARG